MKSKNNPKKNSAIDVDKFNRKSMKGKSVKKQKSSKRRLSIYDDFDSDNFDSPGYG